MFSSRTFFCRTECLDRRAIFPAKKWTHPFLTLHLLSLAERHSIQEIMNCLAENIIPRRGRTSKVSAWTEGGWAVRSRVKNRMASFPLVLSTTHPPKGNHSTSSLQAHTLSFLSNNPPSVEKSATREAIERVFGQHVFRLRWVKVFLLVIRKGGE